jgi:hypothetical protein
MKGDELKEFLKAIPRVVQLKTNAPIVILTLLDEDGEVHISAKGFGWETVMNEALHNALRVRAQRNNEN